MNQPHLSPTQASSHAAHIARRREWASKAKPVAQLPAPEPTREETQIIHFAAPSWIRGDQKFDAHVTDWRRYLFEKASAPVCYIKRRCEELDVDYADIMGPARCRAIASVRHLLVWEINKEFPDLSLHQKGRLFGGRDHTTILHSIKKIEQERAQG